MVFLIRLIYEVISIMIIYILKQTKNNEFDLKPILNKKKMNARLNSLK